MMTDPYGQTNPRPMNGATMPTQMRPVGHITPRMLLAIAAIYNPALLIGYLLYIFGPSNSCVLGGLCGFRRFPGIIQLFLLIVGDVALTAIVFVPLWWLLDEARPARDIVSRTARDMMRFVTIRPLMASLWDCAGAAAHHWPARSPCPAATLPAGPLVGDALFLVRRRPGVYPCARCATSAATTTTATT